MNHFHHKNDFQKSRERRSIVRTKLLPTKSDDLKQLLGSEKILGIVEYNNGRCEMGHERPDHIPFLSIHLDPLTSQPHTEVWYSDSPVHYGKIGNFNFSADGENFFAAAAFPEFNENLDVLGEKIYNEVFGNNRILHYPYTYRIWNYFPYINQNDKNGLERYRAYCFGRATSFTTHNSSTEDKRFPSATGIGSMSGNVNVYFLCSAVPEHRHIENPRQTPAYKYPVQYGPKPPSFARATYYNLGENNFSLYIAGTASVIGHKSMFIDDAEKQCNTTLDNIEILISEENLQRYGIEADLTLQDVDCIKVYIRREQDFPIIKEICENRFSSKASILYVKGDVCRVELLVEIEGIIQK